MRFDFSTRLRDEEEEKRNGWRRREKSGRSKVTKTK